METSIDNISKLGRYGLVGVMLLLITANIISMCIIYKLSAGHISQSNVVMSDLTSAVTELSTIIKLPNRISLDNTYSNLF